MFVQSSYSFDVPKLGFESNSLITDLGQIKALLPQHNSDIIQNLLNVNRGSHDGCMITLGLTTTVQADRAYKIDGTGISLGNQTYALDLEMEATNPSEVVVPSHVEFTASWDNHKITSGMGNNVLGDNGGLYFDESIVNIPVVKATAETLAYYGAVLIPESANVRFPNELPFPIWKMHVGSNYVRDYILSEDGGGGFYLEFHHDQPHFHMIVDGGGYYLLAKQVGDQRYHLTAFELSNGQAVYTKKGAIHCDAALRGHIFCGYTISNDCETVLLRTKDNALIKLEFV